jgi:hypothetical protein
MASEADEQKAKAGDADCNSVAWDRTEFENVVRFFKILLEWDQRAATIGAPYESNASSGNESTDPGGLVCASVVEGPGA